MRRLCLSHAVRLRALLPSVLASSLLLLALLAPAALCAQATTPTEAAAIAVAHADPNAYTLSGATLTKAVALAHLRTVQFIVGSLWALLLPFLLLQLGIVSRMRNVAVNLTRNRWGQCAVFTFELLLVLLLGRLPLALFSHSVGLAYGLSVQGWPSWLADTAKSFALELLLAIPVAYVILRRLRRSPRWWWVQVGLGGWLVSVALLFITPYVIDPLFDHFEPLAQSNPALVAQLERVVARGKGISIPPERMFLMRASDKVTTLNAYVTGFGSSKRVVVWDTSLRKGTPDEILFIFGHEMGHYVLGHILNGIFVALGFVLVSAWAAFHLFGWLLARFGKRWKVSGPEHLGALAVLLLIFQVLLFVEEPLFNAISRAHEHDADVYGQEVVHGIVADPRQAAQQAFQLLGQSSFDDPAPQPFDLWYDTHPTISFRAAFARHYDPWVPGSAPRYFNK